jgi:hypothetical protein
MPGLLFGLMPPRRQCEAAASSGAMIEASALFIVLYRTSKAWPGTSRLVVELRFHRDGI